jgi:hypothetical protein
MHVKILCVDLINENNNNLRGYQLRAIRIRKEIGSNI